MAKKKKRNDGLAFSTGDAPASDNPFAALSGLQNLPDAPKNLPKEQEGETAGAMQGGEKAALQLRVHIDRKYRRGKEVTLIKGFDGPDEELQRLTKLIKNQCGVGGSAKEGEIVIQGNNRERVLEILREEGYRGAKAAGG